MIVEPGLAHRDDAGSREQILQPGACVGRRGGRDVGMDARRAPEPVVARGEVGGLGRIAEVRCDRDHAVDAGIERARDNRLDRAPERRIGQVAVRIE